MRITLPSISNKEVPVISHWSFLAGVLVLLALTGCSRCQECELSSSTETVCETEFDNPDQYEDAIADLEAQGATCTSTGGI